MEHREIKLAAEKTEVGGRKPEDREKRIQPDFFV
jgi:hypothetical protein